MKENESKEIIQLIKDLSREAPGALLSSKERSRFIRDLTNILTRLRSNQYKISSFTRSALMVKEREEDFFTELDFYCSLGRSWRKALESFNIKKTKSILDLCPGANPKIEIALAQMGYQHNLTLADSSNEALLRSASFIKLFDPRFKLNLKKQELWKISGKFDLIVGNHIFDDILLSDHCARNGQDLNQAYSNEERLKRTWQNLAQEQESCSIKLASKLAKKINALLTEKGAVILTHYPSYVERSLKMTEAGNKIARFIECFLSELLFHEPYEFKFISTSKIKLNSSSRLKKSDFIILQKVSPK